jgi:hypothetical protein
MRLPCSLLTAPCSAFAWVRTVLLTVGVDGVDAREPVEDRAVVEQRLADGRGPPVRGGDVPGPEVRVEIGERGVDLGLRDVGVIVRPAGGTRVAATVGRPEPPPSVIVIGVCPPASSLTPLTAVRSLNSAVWSINVVPSLSSSWMTRKPLPPTGPLMTLTFFSFGRSPYSSAVTTRVVPVPVRLIDARAGLGPTTRE